MMVTTNQKMRLGMSLNMLNCVFEDAEVTNGTVKKASACAPKACPVALIDFNPLAAELIAKFRLENKISPFQMIISPKSDVNTLPNMVDSPSRIFPAKRNATQRMKNVAAV